MKAMFQRDLLHLKNLLLWLRLVLLSRDCHDDGFVHENRFLNQQRNIFLQNILLKLFEKNKINIDIKFVTIIKVQNSLWLFLIPFIF